jgi:hypothetical protein
LPFFPTNGPLTYRDGRGRNLVSMVLVTSERIEVRSAAARRLSSA